jgi:hypothetical protein
MKREERGPWYLLTALIIGISLGLVFAWVIAPVEYVDTTPETLREDFKDQFRIAIAAAYAATGDLARARARLDYLGDQEIDSSIAVLAQRAVAEGRPTSDAHNLGLLALALSQNPGALPTRTSQASPTGATSSTASPSARPTVTSTPEDIIPASSSIDPSQTTIPEERNTQAAASATLRPTTTPTVPAAAPSITPLPTRTPTPTPGAPFVLKQDVTLVCSPARNLPLIIVEAYDASGSPVPGVEIRVNWTGGEDRFFTGLKPELGIGYADFEMTPETIYTVAPAEGGQPVSGLFARECENARRERYWGSWLLVFVQP